MIVSNLANSHRIESLHPHFKRLFDYVKTLSPDNLPAGRITLEGDLVYINVVYADAVPMEKQVLETHRDYIDVHILWEGHEKIGWKPADTLHKQISPYSAIDDCALYADTPSTWVDLQAADFLIAYPEDAHAPKVGEGKIHKLIGKVKI